MLFISIDVFFLENVVMLSSKNDFVVNFVVKFLLNITTFVYYLVRLKIFVRFTGWIFEIFIFHQINKVAFATIINIL